MERTAILYIAERCNQDCVFCLEEDGQWTEFVDPSTQQVFDIVDGLQKRGADHITFMGGETFFRKDLPRILTHAKSRGYTRVGVTTNGTVFSKRGFITKLIDAGLDFIEFSLHGHTPELANQISGSGITFERQAVALEELNEKGELPTILNTVICRDNRENLIDVARHVLERYPRLKVQFKLKFVSLQGLAADVSNQTGVALAYREVDLVAVGDYLAGKDAKFWFYNVPLCRLGPHASRSHEVRTLSVDERYFDLQHRGPAEYYDTGNQLEGRVWPEASCRACTLRPICPGLEESYRRVHGADELTTRHDDPVTVMEHALALAGVDPSSARGRLEELRAAPRPERFVRERPDGALRFRQPQGEPLDLMVGLQREGERAFLRTARFALSHRSEDGNTTPGALVMSLLQRASSALQESDRAGHDLDAARSAVARAATARDGWVLDPISVDQRPARRGFALPVISAESSAR